MRNWRAEKVKKKLRKRLSRMMDISSEDSDGNKKPKREPTPSAATEKDIPPVYVFPCFHKPMKSTYAVLHPSETDPKQIDYYIHKFTVPPRTDPIPNFAKKLKVKVSQRASFAMESSAFKDWRNDTP